MTDAIEHQRPTAKIGTGVLQKGMGLAGAFDMEYGKAILSQTYGLHVGRSREIMVKRIELRQYGDALARRRYLALLQAAAGPAPTLQRFSVATGLAGLTASVLAALRAYGSGE